MKHHTLKKAGKQVDRDWIDLRFRDSFGFVASSLSQLVVDLKQSGLNKFKNVLQEFGSDTELMTRQNIYPYSVMDEYDKFDVDPFTITNSDFGNYSTGEDINDCDYDFFVRNLI